jgi:hypothetical protein
MNESMKTRNPLHVGIHAYSIASVLSRDTMIEDVELKRFATKLMTLISEQCMEEGARDIGHIKAYIEYGTGFLFVDTLGDPSDVTIEGRTGDPSLSFRIVINSVIYGLEEEKIKKATRDAIEKVSAKFKFRNNYEKKQSSQVLIMERRKQ